METAFTFKQWLDAYFDHPYDYGYFLDIEPLPITPKQHLIFVTTAFNNADTAFKHYSNGQLKQGLWLIASELHDLSDRFGQGVDWDIRQACIQSFKTLNRKLFIRRCDPVTSAYQQVAPDNPLNMICYMWWDIFAFWESIDSESTNRVDAEFLDVMGYSLNLNHIAVIEGALHGLSHIPNHHTQVTALIDDFLEAHPKLPENLRTYAISSKAGCNL